MACLHALMVYHGHVHLGLSAQDLANLALRAMGIARMRAATGSASEAPTPSQREVVVVQVHGLCLVGDLLKGSALSRTAPPSGLVYEVHAAVTSVIQYAELQMAEGGSSAGSHDDGAIDAEHGYLSGACRFASHCAISHGSVRGEGCLCCFPVIVG